MKIRVINRIGKVEQEIIVETETPDPPDLVPLLMEFVRKLKMEITNEEGEPI